MKRHLLITGLPGSGKTTLISKLLNRVKQEEQQEQLLLPKTTNNTQNNSNKLLPGNFITEEMRDPKTGQRSGFQFVFDDAEKTRIHLAIVDENNNSRPLVGKYSVMVENIETFVVPAINGMVKKATEQQQQQQQPSTSNGSCCCLAFIDEIGKMECLSRKFTMSLVTLMDQPNVRLIATVPLKGTQFIEQTIKARSDVTIVQIDRTNRDFIGGKLWEMIHH